MKPGRSYWDLEQKTLKKKKKFTLGGYFGIMFYRVYSEKQLFKKKKKQIKTKV